MPEPAPCLVLHTELKSGERRRMGGHTPCAEKPTGHWLQDMGNRWIGLGTVLATVEGG